MTVLTAPARVPKKHTAAEIALEFRTNVTELRMVPWRTALVPEVWVAVIPPVEASAPGYRK